MICKNCKGEFKSRDNKQELCYCCKIDPNLDNWINIDVPEELLQEDSIICSRCLEEVDKVNENGLCIECEEFIDWESIDLEPWKNDWESSEEKCY